MRKLFPARYRDAAKCRRILRKEKGWGLLINVVASRRSCFQGYTPCMHVTCGQNEEALCEACKSLAKHFTLVWLF